MWTTASRRISLWWLPFWLTSTPVEDVDRSTTGWPRHPACSTEWPRCVHPLRQESQLVWSLIEFRLLFGKAWNGMFEMKTFFALCLTTDLDSPLFPVCHPLVHSVVFSIFPFFIVSSSLLPHSFIHSSAHPGSTSRVPRCQIHPHACCGRYVGERRSIWGANTDQRTVKQGKMDGGFFRALPPGLILLIYEWGGSTLSSRLNSPNVPHKCVLVPVRDNPKFLEDVHHL